jgi:fumarate hydratase subunit beta
MRKVWFPITDDIALNLYDEIEIYGTIFAGRDAVLPKLVRLFKEGRFGEYGIDLVGSVIFHTAVSPAGIGPTSSNKPEIEGSIPTLSAAGVKIHLGKGTLGHKTVKALEEHRSFFAVTPPVSALLTHKIRSREVVAFEEEGVEALHRLEVDGIPAIIAIANGESVFSNR